jgi:hypothetical protein
MDAFYAVHVELFCVDKETGNTLPFSVTGDRGHIPVIGGVEFPWYLTGDGFVARSAWKNLMTVTLSFLSSRVDVEGIPMIDARVTADV